MYEIFVFLAGNFLHIFIHSVWPFSHKFCSHRTQIRWNFISDVDPDPPYERPLSLLDPDPEVEIFGFKLVINRQRLLQKRLLPTVPSAQQ